MKGSHTIRKQDTRNRPSWKQWVPGDKFYGNDFSRALPWPLCLLRARRLQLCSAMPFARLFCPAQGRNSGAAASGLDGGVGRLWMKRILTRIVWATPTGPQLQQDINFAELTLSTKELERKAKYYFSLLREWCWYDYYEANLGTQLRAEYYKYLHMHT